MTATPSGLSRLLLIPDDLWNEFVSILTSAGIDLRDCDGDRSFEAKRSDETYLRCPRCGDPTPWLNQHGQRQYAPDVCEPCDRQLSEEGYAS